MYARIGAVALLGLLAICDASARDLTKTTLVLPVKNQTDQDSRAPQPRDQVTNRRVETTAPDARRTD